MIATSTPPELSEFIITGATTSKDGILFAEISSIPYNLLIPDVLSKSGLSTSTTLYRTTNNYKGYQSISIYDLINAEDANYTGNDYRLFDGQYIKGSKSIKGNTIEGYWLNSSN